MLRSMLRISRAALRLFEGGMHPPFYGVPHILMNGERQMRRCLWVSRVLRFESEERFNSCIVLIVLYLYYKVLKRRSNSDSRNSYINARATAHDPGHYISIYCALNAAAAL